MSRSERVTTEGSLRRQGAAMALGMALSMGVGGVVLALDEMAVAPPAAAARAVASPGATPVAPASTPVRRERHDEAVAPAGVRGGRRGQTSPSRP